MLRALISIEEGVWVDGWESIRAQVSGKRSGQGFPLVIKGWQKY